MAHFLYLLRHAKSDWKTETATDFERPLSRRGLKDAPKMASWLARQTDLPSIIVSSPALRAYQTALIFAHALELQPRNINFDKRIYEASESMLLEIIMQFPETEKSILLIGHNPGFDSLLQTLCREAMSRTDDKMLTTAAVAKISLKSTWQSIGKENCKVLSLTRPKEVSQY